MQSPKDDAAAPLASAVDGMPEEPTEETLMAISRALDPVIMGGYQHHKHRLEAAFQTIRRKIEVRWALMLADRASQHLDERDKRRAIERERDSLKSTNERLTSDITALTKQYHTGLAGLHDENTRLAGELAEDRDDYRARYNESLQNGRRKSNAYEALKASSAALAQENARLAGEVERLAEASTGWCIRHVESGRWRTLDSLGMPDFTDDESMALCLRLREHADAYAADDPEDVRIVPAEFRLRREPESAVRAAERERCAKVVESFATGGPDPETITHWGNALAESIRALQPASGEGNDK